MSFTKEAILERLIAAYHGPGSADEGSFAGDVLRACADAMAEVYSMEADGLEQRAFVSTAVGDWLTRVCADRGIDRREGESDEALRARALAQLAALPASGNADHYAAWCLQVPELLRVRVLPLGRGPGTLDIVAVDRAGGCPADAVLAQAQEIVDRERPIGADAQVIGAEPEAVDIEATVKLTAGGDMEAVRTAFAEKLAEFCKETALLTDSVSYARTLGLLLDIPGVADVTEFTLCGDMSSLSLGDRAVPVPGDITLREVAT